MCTFGVPWPLLSFAAGAFVCALRVDGEHRAPPRKARRVSGARLAFFAAIGHLRPLARTSSGSRRPRVCRARFRPLSRGVLGREKSRGLLRGRSRLFCVRGFRRVSRPAFRAPGRESLSFARFARRVFALPSRAQKKAHIVTGFREIPSRVRAARAPVLPRSFAAEARSRLSAGRAKNESRGFQGMCPFGVPAPLSSFAPGARFSALWRSFYYARRQRL